MTFLGGEHIPGATRQHGVPNVALQVRILCIYQIMWPGIHRGPESSPLRLVTQSIGTLNAKGALGRCVLCLMLLGELGRRKFLVTDTHLCIWSRTKLLPGALRTS